MTTHRRHFLRLCGIAGIGTLAGCTDSSGNDGTPTPTEGTSTSTEGTPTPTETSEGWTRQATLTSDDIHSADQFGWSVAVSSDDTTALIGAVGAGGPDRRYTDTTEDPNGGDASTTENPTSRDGGTAEDHDDRQVGAVYVFEASGGSWSQQTKLTADDGDSKDGFGWSVALSDDGTIALIGAQTDEDPNGKRAGSAYVFEASGGSWNQQAKLVADDGDSKDRFGNSVAVSGDGTTAFIGAVRDDDPNGEEAGSAYVFEASGGSWSQRAKLTPDDGDGGDDFGRSVAVSSGGTTVLIGAGLDEDPNGHFAGSAYVFEASGVSWSQQAKLAPDDGDSEDAFGWSVALSDDGTTALIGAQTDDDPNGEEAGSAYVFEASGGSWSQQAKLAPDDGNHGDWFGRAVALSDDGTTALIGAENKIDLGSSERGSAYVFEASGGSWNQRAKLTPDDGVGGFRFGGSVAISGDGTTSLIGYQDKVIRHVGPAGSAYVFTL